MSLRSYLLLICLVVLSFSSVLLCKKRNMNIVVLSFEDFKSNNEVYLECDTLEIYINEYVIYPPEHIMRDNSDSYLSIDYSDIDMKLYPNIKELSFVNHYINALPVNLCEANKLNHIECMYSDKAVLDKEITKLKTLKELKSLNLEFALISKDDFEKLETELANVTITWMR